MARTWQGRPVLAGDVEGEAAVSRRGFNTYASFFSSIHVPSGSAVCSDSGNTDLHEIDLAGKILCVPKTTGSTSSGAVWLRLVTLGNAPAAVLFSEHIDPLAAGGLVVSDIWSGRRIVTVDRLGAEFLEAVRSGDHVHVRSDGTVLVAD